MKKVQRELREEKKKLEENSTKSYELSKNTEFLCESGVFLWGQIQCIISGKNSKLFDSPLTKNKPESSGTILVTPFNYKTKAQKGIWIVESAFIDGNPIGYVIHHKDYSGQKILGQAAKVGISYRNESQDRSILYVNRYDFSWESGDSEMIKKEFEKYLDLNQEKMKNKEDNVEQRKKGINSKNFEKNIEELLGGYLLVIDEEKYETFIEYFSIKRFIENALYGIEGRCYGIQVTDSSIEYELAWMIFNDSEELIGMVYDTKYSGLESSNHNFDVNSKLHFQSI